MQPITIDHDAVSPKFYEWGALKWLVDVDAIRQILRTSRGETLVVAITFIATITIQLEFAIFVGVLASLFVYLNRTTHPQLAPVVPDPASPLRSSAHSAMASCGRRPTVRSAWRSSTTTTRRARRTSARAT